jgi:hypothetical protein
MAVITIRRHQSEDELVFEVVNFIAYVNALLKIGIEAPPARYRITVPRAIADDIVRSNIDIDQQVALFFRLGPASGLEYDISDKP